MSNFFVQRNRRDNCPRDRIPTETISVLSTSGLEVVFSSCGAKIISLNWHHKTSPCIELARSRQYAFQTLVSNHSDASSSPCTQQLFPTGNSNANNEKQKTTGELSPSRPHGSECQRLERQNWKSTVTERNDLVQIQFWLEDNDASPTKHGVGTAQYSLTYRITADNEIILTGSPSCVQDNVYFPVSDLLWGRQYEVLLKEVGDVGKEEEGKSTGSTDATLAPASDVSTRKELGSSQCVMATHTGPQVTSPTVLHTASDKLQSAQATIPATTPTTTTTTTDITTPPTSVPSDTTSPCPPAPSHSSTCSVLFDFRAYPTYSSKVAPTTTEGSTEEEKFMEMSRNANVRPGELSCAYSVSLGVSVRAGTSLQGKRTHIVFGVPETRKTVDTKKEGEGDCPLVKAFSKEDAAAGGGEHAMGTKDTREYTAMSPTDPVNESPGNTKNRSKCQEELFMKKLQFVKRAENSMYSSD